MSDAAYFRQLAERCRQYSAGCFDLGASERFRLLAEEFADQAIRRENETAPQSRFVRWRGWIGERGRKLFAPAAAAAVKDFLLNIGREILRKLVERVKAFSLP